MIKVYCVSCNKTVFYLINDLAQEGSSISRQNFVENLETLHPACTQFYHLPVLFPKTGFLTNHCLFLDLAY